MKNSFLKKLALFMATALAMTSIFSVVAFADDYDVHYDDPESMYSQDGYNYGYMVPSIEVTRMIVGNKYDASVEVNTDARPGTVSLEWTSSDYGVVQFSGDTYGHAVVMYANGEGDCIVTVNLMINGWVVDSDDFSIHVDGNGSRSGYVPVDGIWVDRSELNVSVGYAGKINAGVTPNNATDKCVHFDSNDNNIVRVDCNGNFFAVNPGTAYITAMTNDNHYKKAVKVNVYLNNTGYVPVTGVSINTDSLSLGDNQTCQIIPTVYPINATNSSVRWVSCNPNIARVDNNGNVTGVQAGSTIIQCITNDGQYMAQCMVTVVAGAKHVLAANNTRSAQFYYDVINKIINTQPNGTCVIQTTESMSFNSSVATALKQRPDVTVQCVFPLNDHIYALAIPAGYDLASKLDSNGYIEWTTLCNAKGVAVAIIQ